MKTLEYTLRFKKVIIPKYVTKRPYTKAFQDKNALAPWIYYLGLFLINGYKTLTKEAV